MPWIVLKSCLSQLVLTCLQPANANDMQIAKSFWQEFGLLFFTHHSQILLRELLVLRRQGFCHITYLCCLFSVRQMSSKQNPEVGSGSSSSSNSSSSSPFNQRVSPPPHHQTGFVFSAAFAALTFILYLTLTYTKFILHLCLFPFFSDPLGKLPWLFVLHCKAEQSRQYCHVQMWG